jgi:hypothetical protein
MMMMMKQHKQTLGKQTCMAYSNSRQDEETKSDYATTNGLFNMSDEQAKSSTRHESWWLITMM